ncbi:MAG TPA: PaaI family thioesterase [Puia sp.]|jgi:uncharacterized protein (TIGR00369 family)|nr:PaaI family thioesterase [Puia sp.]
MEPLAPHIEQRILASFTRQRLMTAYGATITAMARGFVEISLLPQDFLLRTNGLFHGGVITALADSAAGYAAGTLYETDVSFLTVELKINFLNPAKGDRLITRAKVIKGGNTLTVVQTDSFIENTETLRQVATALLTFIKEKR